MGFGIYKPGQGYWVRMLTAIFAGFLALRAVVWMWLELESISPPVTTWVASLSTPTGEAPAPGTRVTVLSEDPALGGPREVGTAGVVRYSPASNSLVLEKPALTDGASIGEARIVQVLASDGRALFQANVTTVTTGERAFEMLYVQGAAAGVLILVLAGVVYFLVGHKPTSVDFLVATDGEMRKVNWSTRKDVLASTWVVIGASILLAAGLWIVDMAFSSFFQAIDVLKR